jgi:AP-1 complex subunit beta-1
VQVKKVIAAMTVGKDVGTFLFSVISFCFARFLINEFCFLVCAPGILFTDVVKSMQTDDIELKKLIYLYIINYARSQQDKSILVVNTLQRDAAFPNPLVRALGTLDFSNFSFIHFANVDVCFRVMFAAIRTMGCLRVDAIIEYLFRSLGNALADKDPYVRKTAAVCTAKLYDVNPEMVEEQGFIATLRELISDPNPMVVANAVAALSEISEASGSDVFKINAAMLQKLLTALNECTEWGQVFILDSLSNFSPAPAEAESIVERVTPRLAHANSAVVMSAIKVCMKYMEVIDNEELQKVLIRKLAPPLVTLLSAEPEIQYVALRNIHLIVQKRPDILSNEVRVFFCKYNDPIYVKMEKLEIMIKLCAEKNVEQVLMEFKEYATEVDVEFVRRAVRAIGRCAIKLERAAEKCIHVLLELIQTKVNFVVQEAIVVIKDIFRKYPNRYESIIADLCENLENLDEPDAKASMVWIIGEYADRIDNAGELIEQFVENFSQENAQVQLQLLTATVKFFLKKPDAAKDIVTKVLNLATENSDNPDLRDRGFVYWRLLSTDPEAANKVVLAQRPPIRDDTHQIDPAMLDQLISNLSTLSSVYHKPPESFVKGGKSVVYTVEGDDEEEEEGSDDEQDSAADEDIPKKAAAAKGKKETSSSSSSGNILDLDELMGGAPSKPAAPVAAAKPAASSVSDFDFFGAPSAPVSSNENWTLVLPAAKGNGLQVSTRYVRKNGACVTELKFENQSGQALQSIALRLNPANFLGVSMASPLSVSLPLAPGSSTVGSTALKVDGAYAATAYGQVQGAIKTDLGVVYYNDQLPVHLCFEEDAKLDGPTFVQSWKSMGDDLENRQQVSRFTVGDSMDDIVRALEPHRVHFTAKKAVDGVGLRVYFAAKLHATPVLIEVTLGLSSQQHRVACKSAARELSVIGLQAVFNLIAQ